MLKNNSKKNLLRGDTLIEVMFAVGIFGIIAVSSISLMNRGVNTAQTALEVEMARNEIDAQAEALRFIHSAYTAEHDNATQEYKDLWLAITSGRTTPEIKGHAVTKNELDSGAGQFFDYPSSISSCDDAYSKGALSYSAIPGNNKKNSFVINTHQLRSDTNPSKVVIDLTGDTNNKLQIASTYPRLIFGEHENDDSRAALDEDLTNKDELQAAEGIWVTAVAHSNGTSAPQYYDFYIRTCWNSPGRGDPVTISTTIRLYNPDAS